jgi:hypothetical protein
MKATGSALAKVLKEASTMNEREVYASAKTILERDISLETLLLQCDVLRRTDPQLEYLVKLLAEVCFLIAKNYLSQGNSEMARQYAEESIQLYERLGVQSLETATPELARYLPEIMHEGVVRRSIFESRS